MPPQPDPTASSLPAPIGGRFRVEALLGRGGMAAVYRVTEVGQERPFALKRLTVGGSVERREQMIAAFEREFLSLTQLSHPSVIEVYDYGVDETGPYYTMELLDGDDLRARSPLPWREACRLLVDVCSSLALIHSRRLVHRDVSPANIRSTHGGEAKLIDFGAMAPVGRAASVVGTPAFVAPETVRQLPLDGRTDLFSFGATLYYVLTGQSPYPARSFAQLAELWKAAPPPPSALAGEIPEALDSLVTSLLCLEPAMRPRTAFEVMQRLTAIAGIQKAEPVSVSQAYLSTPVMVGRDEPMRVLRRAMTDAVAGRGGGVVVTAGGGMGRTRLLDATALEAKLLGATVLRAGAGAALGDGSAGPLLVQQFREDIDDPTVRSDPDPGAGWIRRMAETQTVAVLVDDVHALDEPSAALLAMLISEAPQSRLFLAVTLDTGGARADSSALDVLRSRSASIDLKPLTLAQTEELLGSLFGETQNLGLVSACVFDVAGGSPRACMDLARHLVDKGIISYDGGGWTLPVRLEPGDLPGTGEEVIRERIAGLPPLARWLAEAQALATDAFGRDDYRLLRPEEDPHRVDRAVSQLLSNGVLVGSGKAYSLAHRAWALALTTGLDASDRRERHRALAALYERRVPLVSVRHLLEGGVLEDGLDRLADLRRDGVDAWKLAGGAPIRASEQAATLEMALRAAKELGRPPRETSDLRRLLVQLSVGSHDRFYWAAAPDWLAQLKHDSGLLDWNELGDCPEGERLQRALAAAAARYRETPEAERVYTCEEALRWLVYFVVGSIAIASRSMDLELIESLPLLLAPFAPLSPLVEIIRQNATALYESTCCGHAEQARARWIDVYERLGAMTAAQLPYFDRLRNALAFAIGSQDVRAGRASGLAWAELLDADPRQHVNALYLRKVMALQMGDAEGAEVYRRKAEVLALQSLDPQMFNSTLTLELAAHALSGDLTGIQHVIARIEPLARTSRSWRIYAELAQAQFQQLRGDLEGARSRYEGCIAMAAPDPDGHPRPRAAWLAATAGFMETLVALERYEEARAVGERTLDAARRLGIGLISHDVARALALAEGRLGDYEGAVARIEAVIDEQERFGTQGLPLGASYEARARIAIWAADEAALKKYASLTAREYRHGRGSALGGRWERLMAEARRASARLTDPDAEPSMAYQSTMERVHETLQGAPNAEERARRALALLCADRAAQTGYLYLVADEELVLVAIHGAERPPDGLLDYVRDFYGESAAESGDSTAALTHTQMASVLTERTMFRDGMGIEHRPVLMTYLEEGMSHYAGVAVLVGDTGSRDPYGGAALVAALSAQLVGDKDARGAA